MIWLKNNNPFNIRYNENNDWLGVIRIENNAFPPNFEEFKCLEFGLRAGMILLKNYIKDRMTIHGIICKYAPSVENDTASYISDVCITTQWKPTYKPTINDLPLLAKAVCKHESSMILPIRVFKDIQLIYKIY